MYSLNKDEPIVGYNNKNSYNRVGRVRGQYKKHNLKHICSSKKSVSF